MDEFDVLDELETNPTRKRSTFLTVLCILTWVGSGGAILYYGYQFFLFSALSKLAGSIGGQTNGSVGSAKNYAEWWTIIALVKMIAPLFTIAGAVLMWNLRKWGFYIYLIGQIVPIALGIWFSLALGNGFGGFLVLAVVSGIIPLGFVVMYAVNLKDMR
jgi:hypothetical protein